MDKDNIAYGFVCNCMQNPRCGEIFVPCLIFSHSLVAFSSDQSVPRLAYKRHSALFSTCVVVCSAYKRHSALFSTCVLLCSALPLGATREKVIGHVEETATERNEPSHLCLAKYHNSILCQFEE